jgi:orotate phosphoribosyltransferase
MADVAQSNNKFDSLDERYRSAANHSLPMSIEHAIGLSSLLGERILAQVGRRDLIVGLANGALLPTAICGEVVGAPTRMVFVRRQGSRYKQTLLKIKEALHIPSSWVLAGPLRYLWSRFQDRYSKLEENADTFGFDVRGLHVVVVDDCIVTGNSLSYVASRLAAQGAAKITTAVLCWTEENYGGKLLQAPDLYLHRRIQWYPWSNNSEHWRAYLDWLNARELTLWS